MMFGNLTRQKPGLRDLNAIVAALPDDRAPIPAPAPKASPPRAAGMFGTIGRPQPFATALVDPAAASPTLSAPDYEGHYRLHGRDAQGMLGRKKRKEFLGLTGREWAGTLSNALLSMSAANGNPAALSLLQHSLRSRGEQAESRREQEASFAEHSRLIDVLLRQGMTPDQAELAAMDPQKLGEEYVSRFRTREASPEETIYTPSFGGGSPQTWTAPKIFEDGPNRVQIDPNAGTATTLYQGKTDAEWAAEDAGISPGTPAYDTFIRDYHLDGQGPTAVQMNRERLDQSNTNNVRTTSTSRDNSVRTTGTSRANNIRNNETSRDNMAVRDETTRRGQDLRTRLRGRRVAGVPVSPNEPMATDKDGNPLVIRNGAWVRAE